MEMLGSACMGTLLQLKSVLPAMFLGLFGVDVLVRLGLMGKVAAVGRPLARMAHLPAPCVPAFLVAFGSLVGANAMLAGHHVEKTITDDELTLGAVFNTVPVHFKETLTYQLPVVLPLMGISLCLIYISTFWLAGLLKLGYVVGRGRMLPPSQVDEGDAGDDDAAPVSPGQAVREALRSRWRLFTRMAALLLAVTLAVQLLMGSGVMEAVSQIVAPAAAVLGLPPVVIAPVSAYIVSPLAGIAAMASLLRQHAVSPFHAIVALLVGGFLMVPLIRLRGTLPRYVSIFGWRLAARIISITTALSLLARAIVLALVLMFFI